MVNKAGSMGLRIGEMRRYRQPHRRWVECELAEGAVLDPFLANTLI
jgi:hypothetical protein